MRIMGNNKFYIGSFCITRPNWVKNNLSSATGRNIKIAVIDSGCDSFQVKDHRILKGISFINSSEGFKLETGSDYADNLGHGSACIDIILQIAAAADIIPIKIFGSTLETSTEILVQAINYAIEAKVDIINLSLGTKLEEALYPLYIICEKAKKENIICVASNANSDINSYPAIFENVISVASSQFEDKFDFIYQENELCECLADGLPRDAYCISGKRKQKGGNSFAAPVISGIVALLIEHFGKLSLDEVRSLLKQFSINNRTLFQNKSNPFKFSVDI